MNKKITVITVCYNSEKTIRNTFDSVLNQDEHDFTYIVIDGASTDSTLDIIKEYSEKFNKTKIDFSWISEPDNGIYNAMNKGIMLSTGDYIGILNSDDTYEPYTIRTIYNAIEENPDVDVFHGLMRYWNNEKLVMVHGLSSNELERGMIEHPTCFVKREIYTKHGLFSEKYKYVSDYEFMLRIKYENCHFYLIEQILANYSENGAGNCRTSRIEVIKLKRAYGIYSGPYYVFQLIKNYAHEIFERGR